MLSNLERLGDPLRHHICVGERDGDADGDWNYTFNWWTLVVLFARTGYVASEVFIEAGEASDFGMFLQAEIDCSPPVRDDGSLVENPAIEPLRGVKRLRVADVCTHEHETVAQISAVFRVGEEVIGYELLAAGHHPKDAAAFGTYGAAVREAVSKFGAVGLPRSVL